VKTVGLKNADLDSAVQHVAQDFFQELTQWTHINRIINQTSAGLQNIHFFIITLGKIAGTIYTNKESIFLEYSAKDIHFSGKDAPATTYYSKLDTKTPKAVGITLNEKIIEDLFMEFFIRR
jgi:hypothetical protein